MNKILPFTIIEKNYGSQYHNFLFGLFPNQNYLEKFLLNNYLLLSVKHFSESHGDFYNEGIYGYNNQVIKQLILRGPIDNLHDVIKNYITNNIYVILNINEQLLPQRRAYQQYYFRHDIIIYGFDDKKRTYVTAGFNENMVFQETEYPFDTIERAYKGMNNEWDYELFAFKICKDFPEVKINKSSIVEKLNEYIEEININDYKNKEIIDETNQQYFINYSYKGYYGIGLYDYLIERVKCSKRIFRQTTDNDKLGVNDLRTLNVLIAHSEILKIAFEKIFKSERVKDWSSTIDQINYLKLMIMQYIDNNDIRYKEKIIKSIKQIKKKQITIIRLIIDDKI